MCIKNRCFVPLFLPVYLAACAGPIIAPADSSISTLELLRAEPLTGPSDVPAVNDVNILAMSEDMLTFLDQHVDRNHGRTLKLHELLYAIITDGSFGLEYDEITRTAQETFNARLGNCLSFTNMFVAMAREIGIKATFQEIEIPPSWSRQGDTYMLTRHVNVVIELGGGGTREIDFNIDDFQSSYDRQLISDQRALAHYYTNIGAEYLQADKPLDALRYFRKAVASDDSFAPAWSNLGVLFSKAGHLDHAEAAYLRALTINPQELVAMSNLGQLYTYQGRNDLANQYIQLSSRHRMQNPYYRYHLAHQAFLNKDYETAIKHLKFSLKKRKNEDMFYFLLGLSYLQKGDELSAHRWLEKAEQVAVDDGLKRNYHNKIEKLLEAS